jgi:N-acetylglucosamine-6-phosphate deacetylase
VRIEGHVLTPTGVVDGAVLVERGRIASIDSASDVPDRWVAPGFIDLQINGADGIDVTTQPERIGELAALLPRAGVTAFLPTVVTCPPAARERAIAAFGALEPGPGAVPLGLHLEGPMLSPVRRGAHAEAFLTAPDTSLIDGWSADAGVAMVTIAPELAGALDVISTLAARGVTVSIGHTDADAATFAAGRAAGAVAVTHLFNAMRPFAHRDPGPIGASLADEEIVAGLICDGVHVDPVAVRMAWRALGPDRLALVTDAVAGARLGSVGLTVEGGAVRTVDGVLAGSVLSLDEALRNLVAFTGCTVADAVATVTSTPARLLQLADRGRLEPGARADIALLDGGLHVTETIVAGEVAWKS